MAYCNGRGVAKSAAAVAAMAVALLSMMAANAQTNPVDVQAMRDLNKAIDPTGSVLSWSSSTDPCVWKLVSCEGGRVTMLKLSNQSLTGILSPVIRNLTGLTVLELKNNNLGGPLPSLAGMNALSLIILDNNNFTSIPPDFFSGLTALQKFFIDHNPSLAPWTIPDSLKDASTLTVFSANQANVVGRIPDFLNAANFPNLQSLNLAFNMITGGIPQSFSGFSLQVLWLNSQKVGSRLSGRVDVLSTMTGLTQVWLHSNDFSGPLPDFSPLNSLSDLNLRDNHFTGPVPPSLTSLPALKTISLSNNLLQGSLPVFRSGVKFDNEPALNRYCLSTAGNCSASVNLLLAIASSFGYPALLADRWLGNDPCNGWQFITCDSKGNITIINLQGQHFNGTISPIFGNITSLQRILLANNNLTGPIPREIANLPELTYLDVSNNSLWGKVPQFSRNVNLVTTGNPLIGKDINPGNLPPGLNPAEAGGSSSGGGDGATRSRRSIGAVVGAVVGGICVVCILGLIVFFVYKGKTKSAGRVQSPNAVVTHPRHSGSDPETLKITVTQAGSNIGNALVSDAQSQGVAGPSNIQLVEAGNMVIAIQVLKNVTNNFSEDNILGKGGFGTVYKGELHDGTKIAVKRMEWGVVSSKGLDEFKSEINVLTRVRHRHLVALLGYCLDGNERLLVYEYMPQGTLSKHLFHWKEEGREPLEWKKRLSIALDVARGVEYLHSLAHQSFIHRDLKPSNILLGDDMRAKVADFGLVRLAPEGKHSVETKLAGTFGYLAPEYAVTGRITTKADVFSFGVILMELISGRKALDEVQPEESQHLVTWFRRMHLNKDTFRAAIDSSMELTTETLPSILTVSELSCHCTAREPYQRPDMSHVVNVLGPLVEQWKPTESADDCYGVDLDMTLPQALKKWQEDTQMGDHSYSSAASPDNTQTSIPARPSGFADSFTSADGR